MLNKELSARRFTTCANHVVEQMSARAADRGISTQITGHSIVTLALWSLLRWERKVGMVALERLGVELDALARDVDRALDEECAEVRQLMGEHGPYVLERGERYVVIDFQTPLEPLFSTAEREALELGHGSVGTEHLLLAIVRLAGPGLTERLRHYHVVYDGLRQAVLEVLQV